MIDPIQHSRFKQASGATANRLHRVLERDATGAVTRNGCGHPWQVACMVKQHIPTPTPQEDSSMTPETLSRKAHVLRLTIDGIKADVMDGCVPAEDDMAVIVDLAEELESALRPVSGQAA